MVRNPKCPAMNGLKYILLQLKDCMMETSCWLWAMSIGDSITATRVEVGIINTSSKCRFHTWQAFHATFRKLERLSANVIYVFLEIMYHCFFCSTNNPTCKK